MKTTDTVENHCWLCKVEFDAASDILGDERPAEGDVSICLDCGAPGIFTKSLVVRQSNPDELTRLLQSEEVVRHMLAVALVHKGKKK
jgi:hypothetical protein